MCALFQEFYVSSGSFDPRDNISDMAIRPEEVVEKLGNLSGDTGNWVQLVGATILEAIMLQLEVFLEKLNHPVGVEYE